MKLVLLSISVCLLVSLIGCANGGQKTVRFFEAWGRVSNNLQEQERQRQQDRLIKAQTQYYERQSRRQYDPPVGTVGNPLHIYQSPLPPIGGY